jgi:hypothetical protein
VETGVLYGLRVRTPRLELRLGSHDEVLELGRVAERGVHPPEEMPFAVAWTDRIEEPDFIDGFVTYHEQHIDAWSPEEWTLRGVPVREYGVAIERGAWVCPVPVTIEGLEPCLPLFGVT